jgi:hypothetical protein
MEATKSSKALVSYHSAVWHHNPEDLDLRVVRVFRSYVVSEVHKHCMKWNRINFDITECNEGRGRDIQMILILRT